MYAIFALLSLLLLLLLPGDNADLLKINYGELLEQCMEIMNVYIFIYYVCLCIRLCVCGIVLHWIAIALPLEHPSSFRLSHHFMKIEQHCQLENRFEILSLSFSPDHVAAFSSPSLLLSIIHACRFSFSLSSINLCNVHTFYKVINDIEQTHGITKKQFLSLIPSKIRYFKIK